MIDIKLRSPITQISTENFRSVHLVVSWSKRTCVKMWPCIKLLELCIDACVTKNNKKKKLNT